MPQQTNGPLTLPAFATQAWQMSYGERVALEGILAQLSPPLAVEIGTAEGGSLRRIAAHAAEVHSFDLVPPPDGVAALDNVTFHTGDSHELLARYLETTAGEGRDIDFVLVDGDHSADGVRRDIVDLLDSDAVTHTVIVLHDTFNPEVRAGIDAAQIAEHPKVALYEPDLVPGYLARREPYRLQMWGGLGLIVVDRETHGPPILNDRFHELVSIVGPTVTVMERLESGGAALAEQSPAEVEAALNAELDGRAGQREWSTAERAALETRLHAIEGSRGWRTVVALRQLRDALRGR